VAGVRLVFIFFIIT